MTCMSQPMDEIPVANSFLPVVGILKAYATKIGLQRGLAPLCADPHQGNKILFRIEALTFHKACTYVVDDLSWEPCRWTLEYGLIREGIHAGRQAEPCR